ncbi:hypothetical protein NIM86_11335 [Notoacmeibacter sp. MSK16QG-6]|nr:hypothetical protein [Notoacmeibacter sp. MSK16QG-6]
MAKRLDQGSGVKLGPFELPGLEPADRVEEAPDIVPDEIHQEGNEGDASDEVEPSDVSYENSYSALIEESVFLTLQGKYSAVATRQVRAGGLPVDGILLVNGNPLLVEVSYYRELKGRRLYIITVFNNYIVNLIYKLQSLHWKNYKILYVLVFDKISVDESIFKSQLLENLSTEERSRVDIEVFLSENLVSRSI